MRVLLGSLILQYWRWQTRGLTWKDAIIMVAIFLLFYGTTYALFSIPG
jgi:hypothetical protein